MNGFMGRGRREAALAVLRQAGTEQARNRRRGFTLIELAIAMSLLMIGMVSVISATSRMHSLRRQNRDQHLAMNAMRNVAERIHARSRSIVVDGGSWVDGLRAVYGPGGSAGDTFEVQGLSFGPESDPVVGSIEIITNEATDDDALGFELGFPRDLNGDGDATDTDVTGTARILPVLLTVRWSSEGRPISLRHAVYLLGY